MTRIIEGQGINLDETDEKTASPSNGASSSTPAHTTGEISSPAPLELTQAADKLLADYFTQYANDIFDENFSTSAREALAQFAPRGLIISPRVRINCGIDTKFPIRYALPANLNPEDSRRFLMQTQGEYIKEMDLYQDESILTNPSELEKYVPELSQLKGITNRGYEVTYPVYLLALGMKPELRNLPVLAIHKKITDSPTLMDEPWKIHENGRFDSIRTFFDEGCIPSLAEIVAVAKQYQVKELKPILTEMNRVKQEFYKQWFD